MIIKNKSRYSNFYLKSYQENAVHYFKIILNYINLAEVVCFDFGD